MGASRATREAVEHARAAARSELPIWITGPSGSGKELIARAIHAWSTRAREPFQVLACASILPQVQYQEIFGDSPGAQSSAPGDYRGVLSAVGGGSLLLHGAEALRPEVRASLLKALAERRFRAEGDSVERPLTARVMVASEDSQDPPFAEIPHQTIRLLPLAKRPEDILPLAAHFLSTFAAEAGVAPIGFTPEARTWLMAEGWSGNVRELRERVRQAVRIAGSGAVSTEALLLAADGEVPSFKEAKRAFETRYVTGLLRRCHGNISHAARLAKKDRKDFYDVIRRTGVDPTHFRRT